MSAPSAAELRARLDGVTLADESRLGKRLRQARRPKDLAAIARQIDRSELVVAGRRAALPAITYPDLGVVNGEWRQSASC